MLIHGSCHCGNLGFELAWEPTPEFIPARACDCTFCTAHGGVWTANRAASLRLSVADPSAHSRYAFGTRTAEFHLCARCGVVAAATSEIDGRVYAVVNVNTFKDVDAALLRPGTVSFDGEETDARLARRARNWIADVQFVTRA
jgi:hypothetical protein